jgi:GDP-4-dehydro-6-deoxy-D-mannose reductase
MRVLVTGADGFVGRHLCAYLRKQGDQVIEALGPSATVTANRLRVDVTDPSSVLAAFRFAQPEAVINLAGFSSVAKADAEPARPWMVNAIGALNVLSGIREVVPKARVLLVGSGETYGLLPDETRAQEEMPLQPRGAYASSKAAAELAGLQFWRGSGLQVVLARPFNHLGKGQHCHYVIPSFAIQIHAIRRGISEPTIRVGNLMAVRDFLHVDDTVSAYRILLAKGRPGVAYNVCSGVGRTIRSLLDEMLSIAGVPAQVVSDPIRYRQGEIPQLVGNNERIRELGWAAKNSVTRALKEVLDEYSAGG